MKKGFYILRIKTTVVEDSVCQKRLEKLILKAIFRKYQKELQKSQEQVIDKEIIKKSPVQVSAHSIR